MKAYTDLPQSKKLAEILPIESADTLHCIDFDGDLLYTVPKQYSGSFRHQPELIIPCWSLAALLDLLDDVIINDEGNEYFLTISKEEGMYYIHYHDRWEEVSDIETHCYYDLIDACYEMILELHRQKLL